jgi:diguanylate cyclase (GGDEF)-like protein
MPMMNFNMRFDPLTNALRRDVLSDGFLEAIASVSTENRHFSILFIDIDFFKSINDAFGHLRGDAVLKEIATRMQSALRANDLLYRYSGDEFIIIAANADLAIACALSARLLSALSATPLSGEPPINSTLSIGIATFPEDGMDETTLINTADKRLYEAKRQGRNQMVSSQAKHAHPRWQSIRPRLFERETASQTIQQTISKTAKGKPAIAIFAGAKGAGFTRLIEETEIAARQLGLRMLTLRGSHDATAHHALKQAFQRRLGEGETTTDVNQHSANASAQFQAWCQLATPGLLLIDDWQQIDASSQALITQAFDTLLVTSKNIGVVLTLPGWDIDNSSQSSAPAALLSIIHQDKTQFSLLAPLSRHAFSNFVNGIFATSVSRAFCDWIFEASSGLPGLAVKAFLQLEKQGLLKLLSDQILTPTAYRKLNVGLVRGYDVPHNLPVTAAHLIGRDDVASQIAETLAHARLVNLIGTGGIGKSAMSMQVAMDIRFRFADGAWFIELAQLTDRHNIIFTIAKTMGLTLDAALSPMASLAKVLSKRQILLVLDNLEQVVAEAGVVITQLLASCPRLTIFTTSRARLMLADETLFQLSPLIDDDTALSQSHAATLFILRAKTVQPQLDITAEKLAAIEKICLHLDGLPLAIELAAARLRTMSLDDIFNVIVRNGESRLNLLGGTTRSHAAPLALPADTAPLSAKVNVKETLRDVIQASVSLLSTSAAETFIALSVMGGRFDVATVNAILGQRVDDDIAALADASLLNEKLLNDTPTFLMLETLREFGQEKLLANGRWAYMRARHLRHIARVSAIGRTEPIGESLRSWRSRMDSLSGDMREALTWATSTQNAQDLQTALGAYGDACAWWEISGHWQESLNWWQRFQPLVATITPSQALASANHTAARCSFMLALYDDCELLYQDALSIANTSRDMQTAAAALTGLGNHANFRGQTDDGRIFYTQALQRYRNLAATADSQSAPGSELGFKARVAYCLNTLGLIARQAGELKTQMALYLEAAELRLAIGDDFGLAQSHLCIGTAYNDLNDAANAAPYFDKAITVLRSYRESRFLTMALSQEIVSYTIDNQPLKALNNISEVIALARAAHDKRRCLYTIAVSVAPLRMLGELELAASLAAATMEICRREQISLMTPDQAMVQRDREAISQLMDNARYRLSSRNGEIWSLDAALDMLLAAVREKLAL